MNTIGIICSIIGAVAVILSGMWFIINRAVKGGVKEHRLSDIEKRTQHADCRNHTTDLVDIKRWIMKSDGGMIDAFSAKKSPRRLTGIGIEIIKTSGAHAIMSQVGDDLITQLEVKKLKTAFDVEVEAYFTVARNDDNDAYNELKKFVYNSPSVINLVVDKENVEVKLDYNAILHAVSLDLRDKYLEKHPELL